MTQNDTTTEAEGREAYDVHAVQEKWLPVWDEIAPFRSGRPDDRRSEAAMEDRKREGYF